MISKGESLGASHVSPVVVMQPTVVPSVGPKEGPTKETKAPLKFYKKNVEKMCGKVSWCGARLGGPNRKKNHPFFNREIGIYA